MYNMSPRQLNLRGASCWLDLLLPVLTQEQILMRVSETILTQWPLRKLRPYVEILKALTVFDILPDIARFSNCLKWNFAVNWNLLDYGTLLKIMVEIYYNINRAQTASYTQQLLLTIHDTSHFSWETLPCVIMSWCQQTTYDVTRITRQMIRQLNSLDIYRQLFNCPQTINIPIP